MEDTDMAPERDELHPFKRRKPRKRDAKGELPKLGPRPRFPIKILGRMDEEKKARKKVEKELEEVGYSLTKLAKDNKDWSEIAKWSGDIAILHNPDQVAGGFDFGNHELPKRPASQGTKAWEAYIKALQRWFGPKVVNSAIGLQWSKKIPDARKQIEKPVNPAEAYAINLLNFRLTSPTP